MKFAFILSIFIPLAILLEGLAALSSIVYIKKYNTPWLFLISFILCYSFLSDLIGVYFYTTGNNTFIYNIVALVSFVFYLLVYHKTFENKLFKKASAVGLGLIILCYSLESFISDITTASLLFSYIVGGSVLMITIILFFLEKLQKKGLLQIKGDLLFWISVGLLLFYVGYLPIKLTRIFFASEEYMFNLLKIVHLILVMIMNICFILGFIWAQKKP